MAGLHKGDVVFVKGVFVTRDINRRYFCDTCRSFRTAEGCVSVYIRPLDILTAARGLSRKEEEVLSEKEREALSDSVMLPYQAYAFLRQHQDISNMIQIAGTVCVEPDLSTDYYERGDQYRSFVFHLASNRIFRVPEDAAEKSTDYPVIRCYGRLAEESCRMIHRGSEVLINGVIQTRRIRHTAICPVCGELMEKDGIAMEIVPRDIIGLRNSEGEAGEKCLETSEAVLLGRAVQVEERETHAADIAGKCGFILQTVRRAAFGAGIRNRQMEIWDLPFVFSDDPILAEEMRKVRTGDLVLVRTVVSAGSRRIRIRCPSCDREIPDVRRNSIYLTVLDIFKVRDGFSCSEEAGTADQDRSEAGRSMTETISTVRLHKEISNQAVAIGHVNREPSETDLVRRKDGRDTEFVFYLTHDRRYRTGRNEKETFRVRCFGKTAEEAYESIHKDSLVLISGSVQARWGTNHAGCPFCGAEARWKDTLTELVPYHVEYLRGCDLPGKEGQGYAQKSGSCIQAEEASFFSGFLQDSL